MDRPVMLEARWLAGKDPQKLLGYLRGKVSDRKLRLFALACCLRGTPLGGEEYRPVLQTVESYADGLLGPEELWAAYALLPAVPGRRLAVPRAFDVWEARDVAQWAAQAAPAEGRREQCRLLRDIAGNPFRRSALRPAWRTADVRSLAGVAAEERVWPGGALDPARLAVLGDALEEAGCTDQDVLAHCRSPGPHVPGCWVVDLVMGKA